MRKDEALADLGARSDAGFAEAKKAFRRQAMKWHPDRNEAPGAEARFKHIRASFEWLESLHESGRWALHVDEDAAPEPGRSSPGAAPAKPAAPAPKARRAWDPPHGPRFEVGSDRQGAPARIGAFFDSFMAVQDFLSRSGARPAMAGVALARGFEGFLGHAKIDAGEIETLRGELLLRFWARRDAGLFESLAHARSRLADSGWARSVEQALDPLAELHSWRGGHFYIFERAAAALPQGAPTPADLAFYRAWMARMPSLFSGFGANERALRFGLSARGIERGPLFLQAALERCPKAAELFAPCCAPSDFATKADWLGMALRAGLDPDALAGWIMADPIKELCARIPGQPGPVAAKLARIAEPRLARERAWELAGAWASPGARAMAAAHRRWIGALRLLAPGMAGAAKRAVGLGSDSPALALARHAIFSDPAELARALARSSPEARAGALAAAGAPLAVACAMRAYFDDGAPLDFMERFKALERHWSLSELAASDPEGRGCVEWFEMALARRGA